MSSEILTIMWHQGDLPDAYYYCMLKANNYMPSIEKCRNHIIGEANGNAQEVILAKVPNFNEYQNMITSSKNNLEAISELKDIILRLERNKRYLHRLLKKCSDYLYEKDLNYDLIQEIDEELKDNI